MARGSVAKEFVAKKISETFGDKVVKIEGSKIYINAQEDGQTVQVAVALTCPKVQVAAAGATESVSSSFEWGSEPTVSVEAAPAAEITRDEEDNLRKLMAKLGL